MHKRLDRATAQPFAAKKAEVLFRADQYRFRVLGEPIFDDEFDRETMAAIFKTHVANTLDDLSRLPELSTVRTALEVGAECCQRAAAVENYFGLSCYAADISLHALSSIESYAPELEFSRIPRRICCDITALPFASNSFDLVFSYQTLHHFANPLPVINEIHRVASQVYVGVEEPTKRLLQLPLAYKRRGMYHKNELQKSDTRRFIEEIFLRRNCNEVRYGAIENFDIPLRFWKWMLESLFECEWFRGPSISATRANRLDFDPISIVKWTLYYSLAGTVVSWIARKQRTLQQQNHPEAPTLICPDCLLEFGSEIPLHQRGTRPWCSLCGSEYPVWENIVILLPTKLRTRLYPVIIEDL